MKQSSSLLRKCAAFLMWVFLASSSWVLAQNRTITGNVSSADGPLPGATVVLKGTSTGTTADANGNFSLSFRNSVQNPSVVVSAVGYITQTIAIGSQTKFNVVLAEDVSNLAEVVVTGYSVDNRRQSTGAVSTIKPKDLTAVPSGNVEQQLQGKVSGITVITNGQPGTNSIVRVRGFGAFGGNEPLYIVDGVPVGSTDFLAPDDIESTTVLKDAASASIYGARAANGVIVYTTKKGTRKTKGLTITYDGLYGSTDPGTAPGKMTPQEQAEWTWIAQKNSGLTPSHPQYGTGATPVVPDYINVGGRSGVVGSVDLNAEKAKYNVNPTAGAVYQVVKANKAGTDWYAAITRKAPLSRQSLGFTGASDNARYYFGLSMQNQSGILLYNDFNRYSFRANTEFDVFKNFRIGENLQFTYRSVQGLTGGNNGQGVAESENDILGAFRMPSIIPVYDEFGGYAGTAARGFNNPRNPVAARDGIKDNRSFNGAANGNIYAEWEVLPELTLRTSVGGGYGNYYYTFYDRLQYENSENNASFGFGEGSGYGFNWVWTNTANYKKNFGVHSVDVLAGFEALNTGRGRNLNSSGLNPFSTDINYISMSTVGGKVVNSGLFSGVNFSSVFGRLNYAFNNKYLLTALVRQDASSRFGANNRTGVFPAFAAAWRVTNEEFMQNIPWLTELKLRAGWGQMGNSNNVDPNNQYSLYASSVGDASYDISGSNNSAAEGFYRSRIGNPNAKWETSTTKNIGFDSSFLKGRFELIFELWQKDTKDLLFQVPLPSVVGSYASAPAVNIANMLNKGIELQVINRGDLAKDMTYELNLTGSWLHNEITALAPGVEYFDVNPPTNRLGSPPVRNAIGQSISAFYGYKVLGLFKDAAEVAGAPKQDGAAPGRFRYEDNNGRDASGKLTGAPDGKIDADDRTFIGSPVPDFLGGLNFKISYKNFDIETYLYASVGNEIFNMSKWYTDFYPSFTGAAISARVKDSWTPSNTSASLPIYEGASNFSTNTQSNSYYVEDGSYLRMQNLSIGYALPTATLAKLRMKKVRVFASVNNLFTLTNYSGLDPAVGGAADTLFGIDIGNYPVTRSVIAGVNLGF